MKVGYVIGRVVLSQSLFPRSGGSLRLVQPLERRDIEALSAGKGVGKFFCKSPSLIVYDELGAQEGDLIGIVEGGEAMRPFDSPMPIDAYNACLFDKVNVRIKD